jgi:hypothetical protein
MIRIEISAAAYAALAAGRSADSLLEVQDSPNGGVYLWLDRITLNRLSHERQPGESYSDTILRLSQHDMAH